MWYTKRRKSIYNNISLSKLLRREKKTTKEFEVLLSGLTLEEIIALKLELTSNSIGGKLYGLPIIHALPRISQEAALMYSMSAAATKMEAARFLGLSRSNFRKLIKKFNLDEYFNNQLDK
jgi:transcriptional regulator of acetoin/glycerol metabolism